MPGMKWLAELGIDTDLEIEVNLAIPAGLADEEGRVSGLPHSPGMRTNTFPANSTHPLLSLRYDDCS